MKATVRRITRPKVTQGKKFCYTLKLTATQDGSGLSAPRSGHFTPEKET